MQKGSNIVVPIKKGKIGELSQHRFACNWKKIEFDAKEKIWKIGNVNFETLEFVNTCFEKFSGGNRSIKDASWLEENAHESIEQVFPIFLSQQNVKVDGEPIPVKSKKKKFLTPSRRKYSDKSRDAGSTDCKKTSGSKGKKILQVDASPLSSPNNSKSPGPTKNSGQKSQEAMGEEYIAKSETFAGKYAKNNKLPKSYISPVN
jgi:hypothetical protein